MTFIHSCFLWGWHTNNNTQFHFCLRNYLDYLTIWLLTCSQCSANLESFTALQNSHRWGPFKRKNIITSSLSLHWPWGILFHPLSTHLVILALKFSTWLLFLCPFSHLDPHPSCHPSLFSCWNDTFLHLLTACRPAFNQSQRSFKKWLHKQNMCHMSKMNSPSRKEMTR